MDSEGLCFRRCSKSPRRRKSSIRYESHFFLPFDVESVDCRHPHRRHHLGPLARIGPNHIITNDPDVTRKVLAVRSRYHRAPWFDAMSIDPHNRNIISEKDSEKHGQLRSKLASSVRACMETRDPTLVSFSFFGFQTLINFTIGT